jgi:hypothetical protein
MHFRIVGFFEASGEGVDLLVDAPDPERAQQVATHRGIRIDTIDPASPPTYADEAPRLARRLPGEGSPAVKFAPPAPPPAPEKPIIIRRLGKDEITHHPWLPTVAIVVTGLVLLTIAAGLWAAWRWLDGTHA